VDPSPDRKSVSPFKASCYGPGVFTFNWLNWAFVSCVSAGAVWLCPEPARAQNLMVTISSDISLGTWTGSGDKQGTATVCVYYDLGSSYSLRATATGGSYLLSGAGGSIGYTVDYTDSQSGGTYTSLPYNSGRTFGGADQNSQSCSGVPNGTVRVTVSEGALGSARPGSYSSTLTLTVTPSG